MIVIKLTRFFYKQHFCKQRQTATGKKVHLFKRGYMINGNENKAENEK